MAAIGNKFKTEFDKSVILNNFEKRGWKRCDGEEDWNIYWANKDTTKQVFHPETGLRLGDGQVINHFPNHGELTRKDLMVKNIKRYRREVDRDPLDPTGERKLLEMIPVTFVLPADYSLFVEEFKRNPHGTWIMKPPAKSQGSGIFLVNKIQHVKKWANRWSAISPKEWYIVSKYIDDPLLIGGKKFDLRMYVLVLSYRPLKVYMSKCGFARFCNVKYTTDAADMDNMFVHLTNVAIQKKSADYNRAHGGKWNINSLRLFLEGTYGYDRAAKMFDDIHAIVINSLKACQNVMINDKHCFEMYGYDIMIDAHLKPWLLEVNASPSLSVTTEADRILKTTLINDVLDIVVPDPSAPIDVACKGMRYDPEEGMVQIERSGDFELLYDESAQQTRRSSTSSRR